MAISAPEDLCNEALRAIGFNRAIGDIYEGSAHSKACLEIYRQTRDEILTQRLADDFARGELQLTLLKGPPPLGGYSVIAPWSPIYPIPGFLYEYAYPSDALDIRALISGRVVLPDLDPRPHNWRIDHDPTPVVTGTTVSGPEQKVILANMANAIAVYRRRVTNLLLWEPRALAAFIARMAAKLSAMPQFASTQQLMQTAPAEAVYTSNVARGHRG